jgi:hypothetical protein
MINYQEELLAMLENNELKTLPSQALIDSDERVVKAVWKNLQFEGYHKYDDYYSDSFETWYQKSNWGTVLQKYASNTALWEELLEVYSSAHEFILNPIFQKDFPIIADHFLKDNDKLIELFNKTRNKEFHDRLTLDFDKKEDVYKLFLINNHRHIDAEIITKYENDDVFVNKLLTQNSSYFAYLNEENRANTEYIKIALRGHYDNFFLLSDQNKEKYFEQWATHYISKITLKNVSSLKNNEQQTFILSRRHDLLSSAIQSKDRGLYQIAVDCLKGNVAEVINAFDDASLKIFAKNKDNLKFITPQLENFVDNYKGAGFSKKDNKMIKLISYNQELKEKLQTNIFYKVNTILESKQKQDVGWFDYIIKKVFNLYDNKEITNEDAKILTGKIKSCLTIDAMKELRIPKENSFEIIKARVMSKDLIEELPVNDGSSRKPKI